MTVQKWPKLCWVGACGGLWECAVKDLGMAHPSCCMDLLPEHSLLSLLSLRWLKPRAPRCVSLPLSTFNKGLCLPISRAGKWLARYTGGWQHGCDLTVQAYRFPQDNIIIHYRSMHRPRMSLKFPTDGALCGIWAWRIACQAISNYSDRPLMMWLPSLKRYLVKHHC